MKALVASGDMETAAGAVGGSGVCGGEGESTGCGDRERGATPEGASVVDVGIETAGEMGGHNGWAGRKGGMAG